MGIDIMSAFVSKPPELDFIWPGFLAGTVGALVAPGGTGKSFFSLEAAMSIACSVAGGDLVGLNPTRTGKVIYFAGDDPETALIHRIHAIGQHLKTPAREAIAQNLRLEAIMGKSFNLMNEGQFQKLLENTQSARLIVLDTLNRTHQLDENSNSDMSQLITQLEKMASITGAAVLVLHHVNKGSMRDGQGDQQQAARGASALIDNARWSAYLSKMSEEESCKLTDNRFDQRPVGRKNRHQFVRFGISKQNYQNDYSERWYQRHDGGVLLPVNLLEVSQIEAANYRENGTDF